MNPIWGQVAGIVTVATMVAFIAIWAWNWLPLHARKHAELARMPVDDAKDPQ